MLAHVRPVFLRIPRSRELGTDRVLRICVKLLPSLNRRDRDRFPVRLVVMSDTGKYADPSENKLMW